MGESVKSILLESDEYSPNSKPHSLPALHWPGLFAAALKTKGPEWIEDRLISLFWDAQWRYKMYTQAHYHSTTHELLVVINSSAKILLGGTDDRARPKNKNVPSDSCTTITLQIGDALLLPAGYAHRMIEGESDFTMIGSYPKTSTKWDMRFPNVMGCQHDIAKIKAMVKSCSRKGLLEAQSPETILLDHRGKPDIEEHWNI